MKINHLIITRWVIPIILLTLPANSIAQNWGQIIKLVASDRHQGARLGYAVSMSGDYAIVGATLETHDASGLDSLHGAGAAYIFKRDGNSWVQQQKLVASDRDASDVFGGSVGISGDYAIVGAYLEAHNTSDTDSLYRAGSAYIFERNGSTWFQQQKIVATDRNRNDHFGISVSLSGDYAIVGACEQNFSSSYTDSILGAGAAYIYKRVDTNWMHQQKITASDRQKGAWFGYSVSISGDRAIVGAFWEDMNPDYVDSMDAGAAYIFERIDTTWTQSQKLTPPDLQPSDNYGTAVTISGDYAIVGSPLHDYDTSIVVTPQAGAAYIYKWDGSNWVPQQKIFDATRYREHHFGYSVSMSGDYVLAGTEGGTYAYMFARSGGNWVLEKKLIASDHGNGASFGWSVAVSGEDAIVGAYNEWRDTSGGNILSSAGAAYVFNRIYGTGVGHTDFATLREFRLDQNYPNPFNPSTTIAFSVGTYSYTSLRVYDILGREITSLVNEIKPAGSYQVEWNAENLPSGVYFCRLQAGSFTETKKLLLLR